MYNEYMKDIVYLFAVYVCCACIVLVYHSFSYEYFFIITVFSFLSLVKK